MTKSVVEGYQVDQGRIYLTGLSMGGRGIWALAVEHPEVFAALAPICGRIPEVPQFMEKLKILKDLSIWVFHGAKDPIVPVKNSELIVAELMAPDIRTLRKEVPNQLAEAIAKALQTDRKDRWASAIEMQRALGGAA